MNAFTLRDVRSRHAKDGSLYHEFLRVPTMSVGLYRLAAGQADSQQPHTEDELYHVLEGRARLRVGNEDTDVEPGSLVFVAANVDHHFHSVTEDLTVLVFFAPAEYSRRATQPPGYHSLRRSLAAQAGLAHAADPQGTRYLDFFQHTREGQPKGIIVLTPGDDDGRE